MISIVIADDHEVVRRGVSVLLLTEPGLRVVGEAADGVEAVRVVEQLKPDILLIDLQMPGMAGIEVIHQCKKASPHTRAIVLSMHDDDSWVAEALRNGAAGFVVKSARSSEVLAAIHAVSKGMRYLSPPLSELRVDAQLRKAEGKPADPYDGLTPRERQVLTLAVEGHTNAGIAARLHISPRTVETHRLHLMRKLGLRTAAELALFAVKRGLIPGL